MEDTAQEGVMSRNTKPFRGRHRLDLGFLPHSMDQAPLTKNLPPARFALGCQKDVDHRELGIPWAAGDKWIVI